MGRESIRELEAYLRKLAPRFFAERMRGASDTDIAGLEAAAGTTLSESHREFLRVMGATPATVLNPFLTDRDFCVATLVADHAFMRANEECLPSHIALFSSSDLLGERIFLKHGASLADEPEVGDVSELALTAEFFPKDNAKFESWLQSGAFWFRLSQAEHQLALSSPYDDELQRFVGKREDVEPLLVGIGLHPLFRGGDNSVCLERGDVAAQLFADGSGRLAGDDAQELERIAAVLREQLPLGFTPVNGTVRNRAARE